MKVLASLLFRGKVFMVLLLAGLCGSGVTVAGQLEFLGGPFLRFIQDIAGSVIRPIFGVPGAAILGSPLELEADIDEAIISPRQDYALAVRKEDGRSVIIDLAHGLSALTTIAGTDGSADLMAISPTGSSA